MVNKKRKRKGNTNFFTLHTHTHTHTKEALYTEKILDTKVFWKALKCFLSDKSATYSQISIQKNTNKAKLYLNALTCLKWPTSILRMVLDLAVLIQISPIYLCGIENMSNSIDIAVKEFVHHTTIVTIEKKYFDRPDL